MAEAKREVIELANAAKEEKMKGEKDRIEDNLKMAELRLK